MSSPTETRQTETPAKRQSPWSLWLRQIRAIFRLEVRKNFFGKRSVLIYLLAFLPIFLLGSLALIMPATEDFTNLSRIFAWIYGGLILRTVVFFGCAWIFMNLFRGEMVDRSLHYYFLAAVRRDVLVVGKYLSGLVASVVLFGGATVLSIVLLYIPQGFGAAMRHIVSGPGLGYAVAYLGVVVLACIGYGAAFLVLGL